ncbi:MAG: HAD family hydrolase [Spirochaetales bacterium]
MERKPNIQLVVLDIDGVLTDGETAPFDLELFQLLAEINCKSRLNAGVPAITVCTGRPQAYIEAVLQALDGTVAGIFEGGAGLYNPTDRKYFPHPDIQSVEIIKQTKQILQKEAERNGPFYLQPCKEFTVSVFPKQPGAIEGLREKVVACLGSLAEELELLYSASCLNILPKGIHKGKGVEFLSQWTGIPLSAMLGVGDSEVDLPMLKKTGFGAAPANASEEIKSLADYVSKEKTSRGLREILAWFDIL